MIHNVNKGLSKKAYLAARVANERIEFSIPKEWVEEGNKLYAISYLVDKLEKIKPHTTRRCVTAYGGIMFYCTPEGFVDIIKILDGGYKVLVWCTDRSRFRCELTQSNGSGLNNVVDLNLIMFTKLWDNLA